MLGAFSFLRVEHCAKHRCTSWRVNALLAYDKIKGTKGNWKESERGRMMKYEIFVSRDAAIYPSVQRR